MGGCGSISINFLDLRTRQSWVVSFTPRLLYSHGKSLRYPLNRRLDGPQSRSERCGGESIPCPCQESNPDRNITLCNASYQLVQNLMSSLFQWENAKNEIYKTVFMPYFSLENLKRKCRVWEIDVSGRMKLKLILRSRMWGCELDLLRSV
jgi:hypothetical protein